MKSDGNWKQLRSQGLPWSKRALYKCARDIRIEVELEGVGQDILIKITGGAAHIGAVALGFPDGSPTRLFECEHHKEGELAKKTAETLAQAAGSKVCVLAGIHYDNITKSEIADILLVVDTIIDDMKAEFSETAAALSDTSAAGKNG